MKRASLVVGGIVAVALIACGMALEPARADNQQNAFPVAVLNVKKVFDASPKFKTMTDEFKADVTTKEADLRSMQTSIAQKTKQRESLKAASDRDGIEKEIADLNFAFAKKQRQYREEMGEKEAEIVGTTYAEMSKVVNQMCTKSGIFLVLRLDEPGSDLPEDAKVGVQMGRQVLYAHPNLDITEYVVGAVKQMGGKAPAGN